MFDACICIPHYDGPDENECGETRYFAEVVTADTVLSCSECGCVIHRGVEHEHVWGKWGGSESEFRTCRGCLRVRASLFTCGYEHGGMWVAIHEEYCVHPSDDDDPFCICPRRPRI